MITEDYVSFEVAKLLKDKGFNEPTVCVYNEDGTFEQIALNAWNDRFITPICAPTLQMVIKWLREVHHHIIEIHYGNVGSPREPDMQWWWELENKQGEFLDGNITDGNTTYEEACNAVIKFCLENLI